METEPIDSRLLDRILPQVQKPARYTGGEYNSVVKDWDGIDVKVALVFPDVYDLGMSNMGLTILYDLLNRQPDVLAERAFAPWVDMEAAMRSTGLPLFSLETRHALADFDIIGISLPYQQLYTNVLTILDLALLPLRSADRDEYHPLVVAGGSAVYNPEPMADFFDLMVVGEGEDVVLELVAAYRQVRHLDRPTQLKRLAGIDGVYVPRFYAPRYSDEGRLQGHDLLEAEAPAAVTKRIVSPLPPPVTRPVVPFLDVVFNRAAIEIQRGCTRGCRFCQAGMIYRPVRERPVEEVVQAVRETVHQTGHREVGLLSLSSTDHSQIERLVRELQSLADDEQLSISLPSSRIESVTVQLVDMLTQGRRTGFTFAPEAASDHLRDVINKSIPTAELLQVADMVFSRGWRQIKLYFMIGQPTETDEDVLAIAELAQAVLAVGRKYHGNKAQVRVGVSTFVPQPHTPFQWVAMATPEDIEHKQGLLKRAFGRGRGIIFNWNDAQESLLEAALVRGDRRLAAVIERAWRSGCRFDGWHEHFKSHLWWQAFQETGLNPEWYATRPRDEDEVFPWDHINAGVARAWLWRDWQAAQRGETRIDCRRQCTACGILTTFADERRRAAASAWGCPPLK